MVAVILTALMIVTAMVLDFGLVRIDRQIDRAAADEATLAGLHRLDPGDGTPHPYVGVCTAIRYLKANGERFSGVTEGAGWRDGTGTAVGNGCTDPALRNLVCSPTDLSTWARWTWTGTSRGVTLDVAIESGYDLAADHWPEDSLPATTGDDGDAAQQGCDQLAVTISQRRRPGLGSLATSADLQTRIRSVGRVRSAPGGSAPALLLLKRTGCPVLKTGASGGGSFIRVRGALAPNGSTQAGTIHSDSDGVGCTGHNNGWVYGGLGPSGIVAYAAPLASNPTAPDPALPGTITSVAAAGGLTGSVLRDSTSNVYGSSELSGSGGTHSDVSGRSLITRRLVDERYFPGVKGAVLGASTRFASGASGPPDASWVTFPASVNACKPSPAQVTALGLTPADRLYVDCNNKFVGDAAGLTLNAGTVYFRGWVNPNGALRLPNAHHVYVGNHQASPAADAISLGNGSSFELNTTGNLDGAGNCASGQRSSKNVLFVRTGGLKQTGGLLRMCRTTTFLMAGRSDACVPAVAGTAPTSTPCGGGLGSGQYTQSGGGIDWTAPDALDATTDAAGTPLPAAVAGWGDVNGPEDLALWSESGTSPSAGYGMSGGGLFVVRGVFMVPNADPFVISGGASLNLTNAQYVASSIELNGNTTSITMAVDPNAAVSLPEQALVGLVR